MAYDGTLIFNTKIDSKNFNKGVSSLSSSVKKLGVAIGVVVGVRGLLQIGKQALSVASDLQEVQNVVDVVFGSMSKNVNEFAKIALTQFGLSELSAKQYASTLGAMGASMGVNAEQNLEMSKTLTGLIGDYASFYNISADRAATALKGIYTGETEALKSLGKVTTEVNLAEFARQKGIDKSIEKMTQHEKVMLRYNYIIENSKNEIGDFARTQDSWANQTRILSERWKEFLGLIGNNLIQSLTPVVQFLNRLLDTLINVTTQFNSLQSAITGQQINQQTEVTSSIGDSVAEQDNLTDSVKDTNKALKGTLASFDEVNLLQKESQDISSSTPGFSFDTSVTTETTGAEQAQAELSPIVTKILELIEPLRDISFDNLSTSFDNFKKALEPITENLGSGAEWIFKNVLVPFAEYSIENTIPNFLDLITNALTALNNILVIAKPYMVWFYDNFMLPLAQFEGTVLNGVLEELNELLSRFNIEIEENSGSVSTFNDRVIKTALTIISLFNPLRFLILLFSFIKIAAKNLGSSIETVFTNIGDFFKTVINNWISIFESFINIVISGLNGLISKLNSIDFKIPDWVPEIGGKSFGINIKELKNIKLPQLSTGTTTPLVSDYVSQRGYNVPQKTSQTDGYMKQILQAMQNDRDITIKLEGELAQLARVLKPVLDDETQRTGGNMKVVTE